MTLLHPTQSTNIYNIFRYDFLLFYFIYIDYRTTTNIEIVDVEQFDEEFSQDSFNDSMGSTQESTSKKRRSNDNEQIKIFENIAKEMKENQMKKMEFIQQIAQRKSALELFFASICKTVEKFNPLEQAKIKISISNIVSEIEISRLENVASSIEALPVTFNDN